MANISEKYVGPGARWAMLMEDHTQATHTEEWVTDLDQSDIPAKFRPAGSVPGVCKCTINFGPGSPKAPVVAFRFPDTRAPGVQPTEYTPTGWEVLSSKTLGRALKACGYPADADEIKLMLLWRRRNAEIAGLMRGVTPAPSPVADDRAIDAAAQADEDSAVAPEPEPEMESVPQASEETLRRVRALPREARERLDRFLTERDLGYGDLEVNAAAKAFLASLTPKPAPAVTPAPAVASVEAKTPTSEVALPDHDQLVNGAAVKVAEGLIAGLTGDQKWEFETWRADANIPREPGRWTHAQYDQAIEKIDSLEDWTPETDEDQPAAPEKPQPFLKPALVAGVEEMPYKDVVQELTARNLPTAGALAVLRERLQAALV